MRITYKIERDNLLDLLNHIDEFKDKMDKFIEDHGTYKYDIEFEDNTCNGKKIAKLIVDKDE